MIQPVESITEAENVSGIRLNNTVRGMDVMRAAITNACAKEGNALRFAAERWGSLFVQKAAVPGTESDGMLTTESVRAEYADAVTELSVLRRARGVRFISFNTRMMTPSQRPTASWVRQGLAIRVSRFNLAGQSLTRKKVGSVAVFSEESLLDPRSEGWIYQDMLTSQVATVDQALLDPTNAGNDEVPAAITYGVPSSASTGDPCQDVANLVADFSGDWMNASFIADANTVTRMALFRDSSGAAMFPDAALVGGSILGLPLIVSRWQPGDSSGGSLALLDGASIAAAYDLAGISKTDAALLEMDDSPTGDSITPTAASATLVPLWQTDAVALKSVLHANWTVVRPGGVAVVTGTDY